jgi:DNA-directed RNA polymerase specialized sigma24 family protein
MNSTPETPHVVPPSLLARVKQYDAEAWERLAQITGPLVYGWTRSLGIPPEDSGKILHKAFQGVSRAIGNFRRMESADGFRNWLWSNTRSKIKDYYRRQCDEPAAAGGTAAQERIDRLPETPPREAVEFAQEPEFQAILPQLMAIGRDPKFGTRQRGRAARDAEQRPSE